jgi:hypothetical protein
VSDLPTELERIVDGARPRPGAFDRWERRMRRHRLRERLFALTIAGVVVGATAFASVQLSRNRPAPGAVAPPHHAVDGIYETTITPADLLTIPVPSPMFSPRDADFLRLGTGRLRLVLDRGTYQLIFYQDRLGPLYLRNEGTYRVRGDVLVLTGHPSYRPTADHTASVIALRWWLSGDGLRLRPVSVSESWSEDRGLSAVVFGAHPWLRVG